MALENLGLGIVLSVSGADAAVKSIDKVRNAVVALGQTTAQSNRTGLVQGFSTLIQGAADTVRALTQAAKAVANFNTKTQQAGQTATRTGRQMMNWSHMRFGFEQVLSMAGPAAQGLRQATKASLGFEDAIGKLGGVMSPEEFKASEKPIRDMARVFAVDFAMAPGKAVEGLTELRKAGIKPATAEFQTLARAGFAAGSIEGKNLARTMVDLLRISKTLSGSYAGMPEIAGKMIAGANESTVSFENLREALKMGGQTMRWFGISTNDQIAILALLGDQLKVGTVGGTSIARMLQAMATQTYKSRDAFKELAILGGGRAISPIDPVTGKLKDWRTLILDIGTRVEKIAPSGRLGFATRLFGVRGGEAFMALHNILKTDPKSVDQLIQAVAGAGAQTLFTQSAQRLANLNSQWESLKAGLDGVATAVGETLGPEGTKGLGGLAQQVLKISQAYTAMYRDGTSAEQATIKFGVSAVNTAQQLKGTLEGLTIVVKVLATPLKWIGNIFNMMPSWVTELVVAAGGLAIGAALIGSIVAKVGLGLSAFKGLLGGAAVTAAGAGAGAAAATGLGAVLIGALRAVLPWAGGALLVYGIANVVDQLVQLNRKREALESKTATDQKRLSAVDYMNRNLPGKGGFYAGTHLDEIEAQEKFLQRLNEIPMGPGGKYRVGHYMPQLVSEMGAMGIMSAEAKAKALEDYFALGDTRELQFRGGFGIANLSQLIGREFATRPEAVNEGYLGMDKAAVMGKVTENVIAAMEQARGGELSEVMKGVIQILTQIHADLLNRPIEVNLKADIKADSKKIAGIVQKEMVLANERNQSELNLHQHRRAALGIP